MQELKIKCPCCSKALIIKLRPNQQVQSLTCPACKQTSPFSAYKVVSAPSSDVSHDDGATHVLTKGDSRLVGAPAGVAPAETSGEAGETMINVGAMTPPASCGRLVFVNGNIPTVELHEGRNIVGREASTSSATVRVPNTYMRISREHIIIDVKAVGNAYKHEIRLFKKEVNATMLNTTTLADGDVFVLNDGDTIKLPDLTIRFEK